MFWWETPMQYNYFGNPEMTSSRTIQTASPGILKVPHCELRRMWGTNLMFRFARATQQYCYINKNLFLFSCRYWMSIAYSSRLLLCNEGRSDAATLLWGMSLYGLDFSQSLEIDSKLAETDLEASTLVTTISQNRIRHRCALRYRASRSWVIIESKNS